MTMTMTMPADPDRAQVADAAEQGGERREHYFCPAGPARMMTDEERAAWPVGAQYEPRTPHPAAPGPDRALELLRELVGLFTDEPNIPGHSDWLDAWNDAWERARAMVEDGEHG